MPLTTFQACVFALAVPRCISVRRASASAMPLIFSQRGRRGASVLTVAMRASGSGGATHAGRQHGETFGRQGARHAFSRNGTVPMSIQSLPVAYVERSRRAAGQRPGGCAGGHRGASGTGVAVSGISMLSMFGMLAA